MCLDDYRQLARLLKAPPMFIDVLPLIVRPEDVEILLALGDERTVRELSLLLDLPASDLARAGSLHGLDKGRSF